MSPETWTWLSACFCVAVAVWSTGYEYGRNRAHRERRERREKCERGEHDFRPYHSTVDREGMATDYSCEHCPEQKRERYP